MIKSSFNMLMKECLDFVFTSHHAEFIKLISTASFEDYKICILSLIVEFYSNMNAVPCRSASGKAMYVDEFIARVKIFLTASCLESRFSYEKTPIPREVVALLMKDCVQWQDTAYVVRR
jgi:hypothetical protein